MRGGRVLFQNIQAPKPDDWTTVLDATEASFNLSRANDALRKSLQKLSTGKRINSPADDAGGLAVAYKNKYIASRTFTKCSKKPDEVLMQKEYSSLS